MPVVSARPDQNPREVASQPGPEARGPLANGCTVEGAGSRQAQAKEPRRSPLPSSGNLLVHKRVSWLRSRHRLTNGLYIQKSPHKAGAFSITSSARLTATGVTGLIALCFPRQVLPCDASAPPRLFHLPFFSNAAVQVPHRAGFGRGSVAIRGGTTSNRLPLGKPVDGMPSGGVATVPLPFVASPAIHF